MKIMFQVTINNIIQYICQCRIRPPNRAGGKATYAEPTPTQGMGGWEAVLTACLKELGPKVEPAQSAFEPRVRTPMLAPPYRSYRLLARYTDGIPSVHVRARRTPFRCSHWLKPITKVSRSHSSSLVADGEIDSTRTPVRRL